MKYRNLGNTDLVVSEWCFGAMRFAGSAAHVPDSKSAEDAKRQDGEGRRALQAALDGGVNLIHSSGDYGTRWLLGEVLDKHPKRSEVHHVIKMTTPDYAEEDFDPKVMRATVEEALTDLHTERIAIVQHLQRGPKVSKSDAYSETGDERRVAGLNRYLEALTETFEELREEGKVGYLATFPHTLGYAGPAVGSGAFKAVVHFLNLVEPEALDLLDELQARGMGFLAIRPLLQGMLTDKRSDRDALAPDDIKRVPNWDAPYALWHRVREIIGEEPDSWTQYALKFALGHPAVTSLVASANSAEQTETLLEACDGDYPSRETLRAVRAAVAEIGMFSKSELFVENLSASR